MRQLMGLSLSHHFSTSPARRHLKRNMFDSQPFSPQRPLARTTQPSLKSCLFGRAYSTISPPGASYASIKRVLWTLIGLNTAVFGAWAYASATKNAKLQRKLSEHFTLSRYNLQCGRYHTLLTSAFSHVNIAHFAFNMLTLNAFASVISMVPGVGGIRFLALCIGSALSGSAGWVYHEVQRSKASIDKNGTIFSNGQRVINSALGASGMVMGVGMAATGLMPFAPMTFMFIPIPVPLFVLTVAYFGIDTFYLDSGSRIGHAAHLGGAVFGAAYYFASMRNFGGVWPMVRRALRK